MTEVQDAPARTSRGMVAVLAAAGVLLVGMFGYGAYRSQPEVQAETLCTEKVSGSLRSPATAKFSDVTVTADGDRYTVYGAVDAENGFGALVRDRFRCDVARVDGAWTVTDHYVI